jgi:hypothetical protein
MGWLAVCVPGRCRLLRLGDKRGESVILYRLKMEFRSGLVELRGIPPFAECAKDGAPSVFDWAGDSKKSGPPATKIGSTVNN